MAKKNCFSMLFLLCEYTYLYLILSIINEWLNFIYYYGWPTYHYAIIRISRNKYDTFIVWNFRKSILFFFFLTQCVFTFSWSKYFDVPIENNIKTILRIYLYNIVNRCIFNFCLKNYILWNYEVFWTGYIFNFYFVFSYNCDQFLNFS